MLRPTVGALYTGFFEELSRVFLPVILLEQTFQFQLRGRPILFFVA
jgi:hypothetical protein